MDEGKEYYNVSALLNLGRRHCNASSSLDLQLKTDLRLNEPLTWFVSRRI
jgi:hypothetical protein